MKKAILSMVLALAMILGTATCALGETSPGQSNTVTVVDGTGEEVTVRVNPKRVAIFDPTILDVLHTAGYDKTGIEKLGVQKTESSLPDYLSEYMGDSYINVGSLFEADYDTLDLLDPELIIYGGRFGAQNESGSAAADLKSRYPYADLLTFDVEGDTFEANILRNFEALGKVFPGIKAELDAGAAEISEGFAEISAKTGEVETLFLMIGPGYITFYGPVGRFAMIHKEFGFKPADTATEVTSHHGAEVNAEYVKTVNPKVILLLDRNASFGEASSVPAFKDNALIQETDAYKNGDIYELDPSAWYMIPGGFTSTRRMIEDLRQYVDKAE